MTYLVLISNTQYKRMFTRDINSSPLHLSLTDPGPGIDRVRYCARYHGDCVCLKMAHIFDFALGALAGRWTTRAREK